MTKIIPKRKVSNYEFILNSIDFANELENEYKDSIKREFRQMRAMGLINYKPMPHKLSPVWHFKIPGRKTVDKEGLLKSLKKALEEVRTPENTNSDIFQVRQMLGTNHAKTV